MGISVGSAPRAVPQRTTPPAIAEERPVASLQKELTRFAFAETPSAASYHIARVFDVGLRLRVLQLLDA